VAHLRHAPIIARSPGAGKRPAPPSSPANRSCPSRTWSQRRPRGPPRPLRAR